MIWLEASVNPNTMQRALSKLEEDGLIITHRTSGRSITEDSGMIKKAKTRIAQEQVLGSWKNAEAGIRSKEILSITVGMIEEVRR